MPKAIFIGVELQRDFVGPGSVLDIPNSSTVLEKATRLARHAKERGIGLILTQDTHEADDPAFEALPPHGIVGTSGHRLASELEILEARMIGLEPIAELKVDEKEISAVQTPDHRRGLFGNVNADRLLSQYAAEEFVLFGLPIEMGIRATGLGLLERGMTTILVSDCLACFDDASSASLLAALAGAGARFLTIEGVLKRYS